MPEKITQAFIQKYPQGQKRVTIRDTIMHFLLLRIEPSGKKTFLLDYYLPDGKRNTKKIGDAMIITPNQAREYAEKIIAEIKLNGTNPYEKKKVDEGEKTCLLLGELRDIYEKWVIVNRKSGQATINMIKCQFEWLMNTPIEGIKKYDIETWRTEKRTNGGKTSSLNRELTALTAMLNWGLEHEHIKNNPIAGMRKLKETDTDHIVRYLSDDERGRLYKELDKQPLSQLRYAVIVSLNTGIRRGALLALTWSDISFKEGIITLKANFAKSGKTQKIPMNAACVEALSQWKVLQKAQCNTDIIFPVDNHRRSWRTLLKKASIKDFRWHDMRHDFASRLVMKGVDLNTVRELLGHSDLKMTMRYAHLAPEAKKKAVDLLG